MKWNFLYQITAASRTPDKGGYRPQIPFLSVLNWICLTPPPPPKKIPGYATGDTWPRQLIGEKRHSYVYLFITRQITVNSIYENKYIKMTAQFIYVTVLTVSLRTHLLTLKCTTFPYTGCPSRNVPDFGRVFLMLKYTDITQKTCVQSWMVMEIMAREVWNFDSCYTFIDYQIHIKTGRNMWFL